MDILLSTFGSEKRVFLNVATHITPVCDCFGFTGLPVLPDLGVFGSDDIIAVEKAVLDKAAKCELLGDNLPGVMEWQKDAGHPFQQMHGPYKDPYIALRECEKLGLGSQDYEIVDVMPVKDRGVMDTYVSSTT